MFIESVRNRNSPPCILLRETYRDAGKVRHRTLANLSKWPTAWNGTYAKPSSPCSLTTSNFYLLKFRLTIVVDSTPPRNRTSIRLYTTCCDMAPHHSSY